jgi:hypothetical protein
MYLSIQGNPSISKPEPDGDSTRIKHAKEPKVQGIHNFESANVKTCKGVTCIHT